MRFAIPAVISEWLFSINWGSRLHRVMQIPMGSCSPEWALSAVSGVGLDGFHISGVALGQLKCGGVFRGDDGCTPSLGFSVDTEFSRRSSGL